MSRAENAINGVIGLVWISVASASVLCRRMIGHLVRPIYSEIGVDLGNGPLPFAVGRHQGELLNTMVAPNNRIFIVGRNLEGKEVWWQATFGRDVMSELLCYGSRDPYYVIAVSAKPSPTNPNSALPLWETTVWDLREINRGEFLDLYQDYKILLAAQEEQIARGMALAVEKMRTGAEVKTKDTAHLFIPEQNRLTAGAKRKTRQRIAA